jgi:hypothetical protein
VGKRVGAYRVLLEKPVECRPLGKPSYRWEDNIKMDSTENGWEHVYFIDLR